MNKLFLSILIGITVIFVILFFNHLNQIEVNDEPFICHAHDYTELDIDNKRIILNFDIDIVKEDDEKVEAIFNGTIKDGEISYIISRKIFLISEKTSFINTKKRTVFTEELYSTDNLPSELFYKYVFIRPSDASFYVERQNINDNSFLIKILNRPYIICVMK